MHDKRVPMVVVNEGSFKVEIDRSRKWERGGESIKS